MEGSKSMYSAISPKESQNLTYALQFIPENSENELYFLKLLDPGGDPDFWEEVAIKCGKSRNDLQKLSQEEAINEVRAERIISYLTDQDKDPVVVMMTEWYDLYEKNVSCTLLYPGFEKQISRIAEIILNREYKRVEEHNKSAKDIEEVIRCKYSNEFTVSTSPLVKRTILQLAAEGFQPRELRKGSEYETTWTQLFPKVFFACDKQRSYKRDFTAIARCILNNDPTTWETAKDSPLELALKYRDDEMSALLINAMELKSKIRALFETRGKDGPKERFQDIIKDPSMKKTVIAVLDATVNKDWPYQPAKKKDGDDKLHIIADDPLRYHFHYRILDGDLDGRPARIIKNRTATPGDELTQKIEYAENANFDVRSISCLQALCQSKHKTAINHPTVRSLARRKWDSYGKWRIRLYALNYTVFLALLSCSLLLAVISEDLKNYRTSAEKFRGFCEICTILITGFYLILEVDQLNKEGCWNYWTDLFNWFDMGGLTGILILIPLRLTGSKSQWVFAAIVYVFNFLRIYKYFPAWKSIGIYSTTLSILIKRDLLVFGVVYFFVIMTFSGSTFLSLRGTLDYKSSAGFKKINVSGFADVFFRGIKSLAQSQGFSDEYNGYNVFSVILIIASMFVIMIFLVNILIAQLSASYGQACLEATDQYDIDKALFVARLDDSRFRFGNLRMKYYVDGSYEYDKTMIKELMSKWEMLHDDN